MKNISIKAIAAGCLADVLATFLFSFVFSTLVAFAASARGMGPAESQQILLGWANTPSGMFFMLLFGLLCTALGGYVAARVSKIDSLLNPAIVGGLGTALGLLFMTSQPKVVGIVSLFAMIPAAMLGGYVWKKKWKLY